MLMIMQCAFTYTCAVLYENRARVHQDRSSHIEGDAREQRLLHTYGP